MQPIRTLGEFTAHVRLTMDLVPEIKIIVHREGESADSVTAHPEKRKPRNRRRAAGNRRKKGPEPRPRKPG